MIPSPMKKTFAIEEEISALRKALAASRQVVLSAPPGAGKSVRVPLALLECAWLEGKKIIMLEPRRLAARHAAEFMARQLGERAGETVGYRIRGASVVSKATRIEVVTEGILTRMLHAHSDLPEAGLVILDEFHERSIHADLGLAFALDVQRHLRGDLRLLLMSATLAPADPLAREEFLAIADVDSAGTDGRIYLAAPLSREQLFAAFADELEKSREVVWDEREERVRARRLTRLAALVVEETEMTPAPELAAAALTEGIRRAGLHCLPWEKETLRFRKRAEWACRFKSEWPGFDDEALLAELEEWLMPHLGGMTKLEQLQKLRLTDILRSRLSWPQQQDLDRLAPACLTIPSGSRIAIDYPAEGNPVLAVKL